MTTLYRKFFCLLLVASITGCSTVSDSTRLNAEPIQSNLKLIPITVKGCSADFIVQIPSGFTQASSTTELVNRALSLKGLPDNAEILLKDWSNSTNFPRILVVPTTNQVSLEQWQAARRELNKGSFKQQQEAITKLLTTSLDKNLVFDLDIKEISWNKNDTLVVTGTGKNMFQIANSNVTWALKIVRLYQGCLATILVGADARNLNSISESRKLISEISAI